MLTMFRGRDLWGMGTICNHLVGTWAVASDLGSGLVRGKGAGDGDVKA